MGYGRVDSLAPWSSWRVRSASWCVVALSFIRLGTRLIIFHLSDWMVSELIKGFDIDVSANSNSLVATGVTAPLRLEAYLKTSEETTWNEKAAVYGHNAKGKKILSFLPPTAG